MTEEVKAVTEIVFGTKFWIATAIFILVYGLIVTEKIHKTILAIVGASTMIVLGILTQEDAFHSTELGIDWNVIFLLVSMMIIINIMKPTGVFEYIAIKSAESMSLQADGDVIGATPVKIEVLPGAVGIIVPAD